MGWKDHIKDTSFGNRVATDTRPLSGLRVVSFTLGAAGPMVANCLGFFGADVFHIESRIRPDGHRGGHNSENWNKSPTFVKLHRNQKSITLNFSDPEAVRIAKELVNVSDVVVENFRLGVLTKWGLDYSNLRLVRPDLVMISLRGFGSTGPYDKYATWGPNLGALLGMTHLWNYKDANTPTAEARSQHPDFMSGVCGAFAVMAALIHRTRTGEGQWIDAAQIEAGAVPLGPLYMDYLVNKRDHKPSGNNSHSAVTQGVYRCEGEDQWCTISIETEEQWRDFCFVLEKHEWLVREDLNTYEGRIANKEEIDAYISEWTKVRSKYKVMETLQASGILAAAVQDVEDLLKKDVQLRDRGFFVELDEPELGVVQTEGFPARLSETPGEYQTPAPLIGQHNLHTLKDVLGFSEEEVLRFEQDDTLY